MMHTRIVGDWIVHQCMNCNLNSHAVHQHKGAAWILISNNLLVITSKYHNLQLFLLCCIFQFKDSILDLQKSDCYSNVFKIIVHNVPELDEDEFNGN